MSTNDQTLVVMQLLEAAFLDATIERKITQFTMQFDGGRGQPQFARVLIVPESKETEILQAAVGMKIQGQYDEVADWLITALQMTQHMDPTKRATMIPVAVVLGRPLVKPMTQSLRMIVVPEEMDVMAPDGKAFGSR